MNKTRIEWYDYTWNPVTGCWGPGGTAEKPNRCPYCYAEKIARRFNPNQITPHPINGSVGSGDPFQPIRHRERLDKPNKIKRPSKIFVCSMGDLFGDWILKNSWIQEVIDVAHRCSRHTFIFLTKNPKRLKDFNPWPENCWVGTTVTNQADADERLPWLLQAEAPVLFVSMEPLLGEIDLNNVFYSGEIQPFWSATGGHMIDVFKDNKFHRYNSDNHLQWAIIGAMTGPGAVKPEPEWVQSLIDQYRAAGVPIFLKDNLHWPKKIQEFPHGL